MTALLDDGLPVVINRWLGEWDVYGLEGRIECGSIAPGLMAVLEVERRRDDARAAFTALPRCEEGRT